MSSTRNFVIVFAAVGGLLLTSACGSDGSVDDAKNAAKDLGSEADNGATAFKESATVEVDGVPSNFHCRIARSKPMTISSSRVRARNKEAADRVFLTST